MLYFPLMLVELEICANCKEPFAAWADDEFPVWREQPDGTTDKTESVFMCRKCQPRVVFGDE